MAVPIQLALQGGGAKITYLVAALEALQELERSEVLKVTRIAGTSAGAIAGALYAAGVDMGRARDAFAARKDEFLRAFPSKQGKIRIAYNIATRRPFWDANPLNCFLKDLLGTNETLGDLNIPLVIVASDLTNMVPVVYQNAGEPLVSSLLDSAAIPFLFRTPPRPGSGYRVIVDGGISENLPSENISFSRELGEVLGIAFSVSRISQNPTSFLGFAQALLETAMNTSILRAQLALGLNMFTIQNRAGTFDFARSFEVGLDAEYRETKLLAEKFFRNYFDRHTRQAEELFAKERAEASAQVINADLPQTRLDDMIASLRSMYQLQQEPMKFEFLSVRLEVTCRSQVKDAPSPDELQHVIVFRATDQPISCHKVSLSSTAAEINDTQCEVFDTRGEPVPVDIVPITQPAGDVRDYLVFFRTPIQANDVRAPITLRVKDAVRDGMQLRKSGRDEVITRASRADRPIRTVELIVHLPMDLKDTLMAPAQEHPAGSRMSPAQLMGYPAPAGFTTLGWRGDDVPPNALFGCILLQH